MDTYCSWLKLQSKILNGWENFGHEVNEPLDSPAPPWCDSEHVEDRGQAGTPAAGVAAVAQVWGWDALLGGMAGQDLHHPSLLPLKTFMCETCPIWAQDCSTTSVILDHLLAFSWNNCCVMSLQGQVNATRVQGFSVSYEFKVWSVVHLGFNEALTANWDRGRGGVEILGFARWKWRQD
jgi:hypothetical protein